MLNTDPAVKNAEVQFAGKKAAIYTSKSLFIIGAPALRGMAESGQLGFQDAATPIMEGLIDLHHDIMFFLVFIVIFVLYLLSAIIILFHATPLQTRSTSTVTHHTWLEIIWTIVPTIILIFIAFPSFALLYSMDDLHTPSLTLKVVGRQ